MISKKKKVEKVIQNEEKWSQTLMDAGWTVIPTVILEKQQALGLDGMDINIILHLAKYWSYADNPPHPTKQLIADCIGVSASTVQNRIAKMEKKGLIKRKKRHDEKEGQKSNSYLLDGLIKAATPFAIEMIESEKKSKKLA